MLREIVKFSKHLEEEGIYELIQEEQQKIDAPIIVIPLNSIGSEIDFKNTYALFKDFFVEEGNSYGVLDDGSRGDKKIYIDTSKTPENFKIVSLHDENCEWQDVFKKINLYTAKPSNDAKGNKSIGSNKGVNSYNVFIFNGKLSGILKDKATFSLKLKSTFEKNIIKGFPADLSKDEFSLFYKLLESFSYDESIDILWEKVDKFIKSTLINEKGNAVKALTNLNFIVKLNTPLFKKENVYFFWYEKYLSKKVFKSHKDKYPVRNCNCCQTSSLETWLPNSFHNLEAKKDFILHQDRQSKHNIAVCSSCCLYIHKFQEFFLNKLKISAFPLFVDFDGKNIFSLEIQYLKRNLSKVSFKNIIEQIYKNTNLNDFNYFLILYDRNDSFIAYDYITGFKLYHKGMSLFQVEAILNKDFFENKLYKNYFKSKLGNIDNASLVNLLYNYRSKIFDYVYRAKYNSLNNRDIKNIFLSSLKIKFKNYADLKQGISSKVFLVNIAKNINSFYKLDSFFGGDILNTVERIKFEKKVKDMESLSFFIGQAVYFLLTKSEKSDKTHAMVEPFINLNNFSAVGLRLEELFNAYKHKLRLISRNVNNNFSKIWGFLYDNKQEKFTKDLKILFYAGYFDTDSNMFFEKSKKSKGEKENNNE